MKKWILGAMALVLALPVAAAPLTATPSEAFVLLNNAAAYKDKGGGALDWQENLTLGDKVLLLGGITKMKANNAEREYYKVKLPNGKEAFVRTILLGVGGTLGVVKADTSFLYSEPRDVKITDRTLLRGQVVVVLKEGATDQFIKIAAYDAAKDTSVTESFVAKEDVSINDVDANAIILLTVAKSQKNATLKKNLLTVASTKYATSLFIDLVRAQMDPPAPGRATKAASGTATVNDDKVNLRDQPNQTGSNVVGQLAKGSSVEVLEMTADKYTVDGVSGYWYRIKDPAGWVFGSFLSGL